MLPDQTAGVSFWTAAGKEAYAKFLGKCERMDETESTEWI